MALTHEEMFYLATGLVDLSSWTGTSDDCSNQRCSGRRSHRTVATGSAHSPAGLLSMSLDSSLRTTKTTTKTCNSTSTTTNSTSRSTSSCDSSPCWAAPSPPLSSPLCFPPPQKGRGCSLSSSSLCSLSPSSNRRSHCRHYWNRTSWRTAAMALVFLVFSLSLRSADGCSSRSTPKPRPPPSPIPSPAVRPNITFPTYACPSDFQKNLCLNNATCFMIKVGTSDEFFCQCRDGYQGARCEYKMLAGFYTPHKEKLTLERASIAGGATMAVVLVVILSVIFYTYVRQRRKEQRLHGSSGHHSAMPVCVEKLQRRRGTTTTGSSGGCRCGAAAAAAAAAAAGKSCILLHQLAAPLPPTAAAAAAAAGNQGNQAKLVQVDGRQSCRITCADLAVDLTAVAHHSVVPRGHHHQQQQHQYHQLQHHLRQQQQHRPALLETSNVLMAHVALPVADVAALYRDLRAASATTKTTMPSTPSSALKTMATLTTHRDHTAVTLTEAMPNGGQNPTSH